MSDIKTQDTIPKFELDGTSKELLQPTQVGNLVIHTLSSPKYLDTILEELCDLAQHTASPNAFYEPAFFQAATENIARKNDWRIILVLEAKTRCLVGFFPFVLRRKYRFLSELSLWKSPFNYLTTPLVREGYEAVVLENLFQYLKESLLKIDLIAFPMIQASGRLHQELNTLIRNRLLTTFEVDHYSRAELRFGRDYEEYVKQSIGGHHLRGYRRQLRNLNKIGQAEFRVGTDPNSAAGWASWFLDLEASGWKGNEGTAMQLYPEQAAFFRELVSQGMQKNQLEMIGLFLNGEPIAMGCTLLSSTGGFTYKIAFDENYKKYSPGILLQLHITERLLQEHDLKWLDSCAVPNHPMINRLWQERRSIQHLLISTGRPIPNLILGSLPLLRAIKRTVRKSRK